MLYNTITTNIAVYYLNFSIYVGSVYVSKYACMWKKGKAIDNM